MFSKLAAAALCCCALLLGGAAIAGADVMRSASVESLSEEQRAGLDAARQLAWARHIDIVRLDGAALAQASAFNFVGARRLAGARVVRTRLFSDEPGTLTWEGDIVGASGNVLGQVSFVLVGGSVAANFFGLDPALSLHPLRGDAYAVIEIDSTLITAESTGEEPVLGGPTPAPSAAIPPAVEPPPPAAPPLPAPVVAPPPPPPPATPTTKDCRRLTTTVNVRVLIIATKQVSTRYRSENELAALARNSIGLTNKAFWNSYVNVRLDPAIGHPYVWRDNNLDEKGFGVRQLLFALEKSSDYQALRDRTRADIVVLLAMNAVAGDNPGIAVTVDKRAVSVVNPIYGTLAGQYTFPHEVGHLFGADHNPKDAQWPAPAHDIRNETEGFRTVMSYPCAKCGQRILEFSHPGRCRSRSSVCGDEKRFNNAAVICSRARAVAAYR